MLFILIIGFSLDKKSITSGLWNPEGTHFCNFSQLVILQITKNMVVFVVFPDAKYSKFWKMVKSYIFFAPKKLQLWTRNLEHECYFSYSSINFTGFYFCVRIKRNAIESIDNFFFSVLCRREDEIDFRPDFLPSFFALTCRI